MIKVFLESPYAGDVSKNVRYARKCMVDCLGKKEAPFCSHLLYAQPKVLDDLKPEERSLGIEAGSSFRDACAMTVVYIDNGISTGMLEGIKDSIKKKIPVEFRSLNDKNKSLVEGINITSKISQDSLMVSLPGVHYHNQKDFNPSLMTSGEILL